MRKALLIGALFSSATLTFATNGDNLIGLTPASRGMGGIGVGMPVGPVDSIFRNPAWMSVMENKFTVQFGGILFMPKVKARIKSSMGDSGWIKSKADTFVVPEIGIVHRISDRLVFGLGAFGVSGMGVDYRNKDELQAAYQHPLNMHTAFQFMRIIPALAFQVNDMVTISGAIHGAWGSLDMGANQCIYTGPNPPTMADLANRNNYACTNASGGQSQALGIGFQLGASLNFGDFLYAGLTYQSPVSMTYKRVFDTDGNEKFEDLKLQQPQEVAFGLGAAPLDGLKVGLDVRWINWKNADGYGDFKWKDQVIYSIGAEYKPIDKLSLRVGWNYGKTPIRGKSNLSATSTNNIPNFAQSFPDFNVEFFNLAGFPAITENHLTLGLGYDISKTVGIDVSYVRAFNKTVESSGTSCIPNQGSPTNPICQSATVGAKNAQDSISVGLNWKF